VMARTSGRSRIYEREVARTPKATNISQFYDSANGSRNPGIWPSLLRRSWEMRHGQTYPYPHGQDNWKLRPSDARAGQYNS